MNLLVIDGNSILNRAFYGIKLLSTKDGRFTNGIYGFLNIFLKLKEMCRPDGVAVAFDLRAPTFRHKIYDAYKAGRHAMPEELAQQMPVLKELLTYLGFRVVEQEGWEADDILGTLAKACREAGGQCYIATGDRDSLQLAYGGVQVLMAGTKMGQAVTTIYDEAAIMEEYGVTPEEMIQVKALQGDASDNIPGVAGVGQKTALDLIRRFHTIDYIYAHIDELEIKPGVRQKLINSKENAYLSLKLGTIAVDAPVDCALEHYVQGKGEPQKAAALLSALEMYKMIDRLGLKGERAPAADTSEPIKTRKIAVKEITDIPAFAKSLGQQVYLHPIHAEGTLTDLYIQLGDTVCVLHSEQAGFDTFLKALFADETVEKYCTHSKLLYHKAIDLNTELHNVKMDTTLAGYLLNPSSSNYAPERLMQEYAVAVPTVLNAMGEEDEALSLAASIQELCEKMLAEIGSHSLTFLLFEVEIPLARVLARMEHEGFAVDAAGIRTYGAALQERINELTKAIYDIIGYELNLNSPKQLGEALFDKLMLPAKKKTKSGYSTNAEVLESLRTEHPVIDLILEYRTLAKLKSTYCDGLVKVIGTDGRIHTSFNQVETRTGRISSTEPNLQNIPVRSELGRELRRFFRAKEGCVLIDADYSQIELRVLADLANDQNMIAAFNHNDDIHAITASQVFNLPLEMMTPLMRSRAKAVNFGIVYGIGAFSLAKDIGVTRREADSYIKGYLEHYDGVRRYMDSIIALAKEKGYSETLFGRRRYLPELTASNAVTRSFGERVARNMPIQGTAADIIKIAMVKVEKRLLVEQLEARLILQVHDELIVEAPIKEADKALKIVVEEMENACQMKVKLLADGHIGKTWYDAKG